MPIPTRSLHTMEEARPAPLPLHALRRRAQAHRRRRPHDPRRSVPCPPPPLRALTPRKPVVQHSLPLAPDQLVAVTQYHRDRLGAPLAVGRMAVSSDTLRQADERDVKGKAVYVLHTWKDFLWEMGANSRMEVPEPREVPVPKPEEEGANEREKEDGEGEVLAHEVEKLRLDDASAPAEDRQEASPADSVTPSEQEQESASGHALSPEGKPCVFVLQRVLIAREPDVSSCLRSALLQAIQKTLSSVPPSTFPITASTFWSTYVLPSRPVQPLGAGVPIGTLSCSCCIAHMLTWLQTLRPWT